MSMTPPVVNSNSQPVERYDSILLNHVAASALIVDPDIRALISLDGHALTLTNINESDLASLSVPVNNPTNPHKITLKSFSVYDATQSGSPPSRVYGLEQTVQSRFVKSDFAAYAVNNATHKPFAQLFNGKTLPELTDALSSISGETSDLLGTSKKYTIVYRNDWSSFWKNFGNSNAGGNNSAGFFSGGDIFNV